MRCGSRCLANKGQESRNRMKTTLTHDHHVALIDTAAQYKDIGCSVDGKAAEGGPLHILVPSGVYHPHDASTTRFLLYALPEVKGLDVLEIGGGSGALSLAIKQRGAAKVVVTDISEAACATMECNALLNNLEIDVRHGGLFSPVEEGERFDLVIFNVPLKDKPVENRSELALCDHGGALLSAFLEGLPKVVNPSGTAIFTHATISAPLPEQLEGVVESVAEMQRNNRDIFRVMLWKAY